MKNIIILLFIILASSCCLDYARSLRTNIKPYNWEGEVISIFYDSSDRMTSKVALKNKDTADIYAYEMLDWLQVGDSIIKKQGSLKYTLKRKGETPREFYPKCNGVEIK